MTDTELFLDKYRKLEYAIRTRYSLPQEAPAVAYLKRKKEYEKYLEQLQFCADVRNLLSHTPKLPKSYAVTPSRELLDFLDFLTDKVQNRPKCRDIAIPYGKVCRKFLSDNLQKTVLEMRTRGFSHIPIVANKRVVGLFDKKVLFDFLADNIKNNSRIPNLSEYTFADIERYISLTSKEKQDFLFVPSNMYIDKLEGVFEKENKRGRKINLVFLTATGKDTEPLQGLLTPWDVLALE